MGVLTCSDEPVLVCLIIRRLFFHGGTFGRFMWLLMGRLDNKHHLK
jgi:hypothetical protein